MNKMTAEEMVALINKAQSQNRTFTCQRFVNGCAHGNAEVRANYAPLLEFFQAKYIKYIKAWNPKTGKILTTGALYRIQTE
jgi:hypothetical protein